MIIEPSNDNENNVNPIEGINGKLINDINKKIKQSEETIINKRY